MTDVTSQLEANGLPTQFESTSNQPDVIHATSNSEATISNAEASQIKQNAPNIDVTTSAQPVQPISHNAEPSSEQKLAANDVGIRDTAVDTQPVQVNGHKDQETVAQPSEVTPAQEKVVNSLSESGLPLPTDIPSAQTAPSVTEPGATVVAQITTLPDQAPISDLRTSPHSDALDANAVAKIEAAKHEVDNNVAPVQEPTPPAMDVTVEPSATQEDTEMTEQPPPTPPVAEPLPATQLSEPNGTIVQSVESVSLDATMEKPTEPAPTPAVPAPTSANDQEMTDAPQNDSLQQQAAKHDRDEDIAEEPTAKRMKTDESEDTPLAQVSASTAANNASAAKASGDDVVTPMRLQHLKRVISNLKKSAASLAFRLPVDPVALNIPHYPTIITKPMDLHTIDVRLKEGQYTSIAAFRADFNQIVMNCVTFNGPDHAVTQSAKKMESSFNSQMTKLPAATDPEPKAMPKPKLDPVRAPPPRRQSVTAKATSPKAASPATFAPDPNGMPLIRRDSAIDGRPKRAIVPPKRNSDFGGARPKKKKYELELRFCDEVLKIISAPKHWTANQYFTHPVDPVALNIPTYFQIIKKPMDLSTVRQKLDSGMYEKAKDFEEDVRLIFKNCYKFNPKGDYVYQRGEELESLFNKEWEKKQDWISAREPDSEPASVKSEDESEEEEEVESDEEERADEIAKLQAQLEAMQNQMMELKNKKKSPGAGKAKKSSDKKAKKPTSKFPGLQKAEKPKKPAKKAKADRDRFVSFAEKQYISNGIAMLPERPMQEALRIIQTSVPQLTNSESGEIELDIEEVPNHALLKLLDHVKKYAGPPPEESKEPEYSVPAATTNTTSKKKSKSLTKHEQEAQIASLKGQLQTYDKGSSPDAMQSIENGADDSDNDSNEESEEE